MGFAGKHATSWSRLQTLAMLALQRSLAPALAFQKTCCVPLHVCDDVLHDMLCGTTRRNSALEVRKSASMPSVFYALCVHGAHQHTWCALVLDAFDPPPINATLLWGLVEGQVESGVPASLRIETKP